MFEKVTNGLIMQPSKIEAIIRDLIVALGDDPDRDGLKETPQRCARMLRQMLMFVDISNETIANTFGKTFYDDSYVGQLIEMDDIECFSFCEHHLALIYDMKVRISYISTGYVIGLSKMPRIVKAVCQRLQLQERIGTDIHSILSKILNTDSIEVTITAKHSCVTARGISNSTTTTTTGSIV